MNFKVPLLIVIVFLKIQTAAAEKYPVNIEAYLKNYLESSENYKRFEITNKIVESQFEISKDLWATEFQLSGKRQKQEYDYAVGSLFDREEVSVSAGLVQKAPTGSEITFLNTTYPKVDDLDGAYLDSKWQLSMSQDLGQNFLGQNERTQREIAKNNLEEAKILLLDRKLRTCMEGIELYLEAYLNQQIDFILNQTYIDSKAALSIAENSFKKKVIRKIDVLAARSDHLQSSANKASSEKKLKQVFSSLVTFVEWPELKDKSLFIESPETYFYNPPTVGKIEQNLKIKSLRWKKSSLDNQIKVARMNSRPDLDLTIEVGQSEGRGFNPSSVASDIENKYVMVGLSLKLPVFSKTNSERVKQAQLQYGATQLNEGQLKEETKAEALKTEVELESLKTLISLSAEKVQLYQDQVSEAKKQLRSGQINFIDFIGYRNAYLNEKLNQLKHRVEYWQGLAKRAQIYGQVQWLCRVVQ